MNRQEQTALDALRELVEAFDEVRAQFTSPGVVASDYKSRLAVIRQERVLEEARELISSADRRALAKALRPRKRGVL